VFRTTRYVGLLRPLLARYNVSLLSDFRATRALSADLQTKLDNVLKPASDHPSWRGHQWMARLLADNLMHEWRSWAGFGFKATNFGEVLDVDIPLPPSVFCQGGEVQVETLVESALLRRLKLKYFNLRPYTKEASALEKIASRRISFWETALRGFGSSGMSNLI
jgi:hypothetical protein